MTEYIKNKKNLISDICRKYAVESLYLIGSVSRNEMSDESDIDFLYSFKEDDITDNIYADHFFSFKTALQEVLKTKVDLVAQDYLKNPYFIKSIDRDKVLIYEA